MLIHDLPFSIQNFLNVETFKCQTFLLDLIVPLKIIAFGNLVSSDRVNSI